MAVICHTCFFLLFNIHLRLVYDSLLPVLENENDAV